MVPPAMSFVVYINGLLLVFLALCMGAVALMFPETGEEFLTSFLLAGTFGLFLVLATWQSRPVLERLDAFVLTSSVWMTGAIAGALPLWLWRLTPADAFFEAMSGLTTTGSSVLAGLDTFPKGILFWRTLLVAFGGIGFVVAAIALLPMMKVGGMQLYRTESSDKSDKEFGSARTVAMATVWTYVVLWTACSLVYFLGGMSAFDATTHAMSTISTGGYGNYDSSFAAFESPFLEWAATFFMLCGGLPFAWYIRAATRRQFGSEQVRVFLAFLAITSLVIAAWRTSTSDWAFLDSLRYSAFHVVSIVTTTGFVSTDYTTWGPFAAAIFLVLTAVGGCTGSTSGGGKMMRWIIFSRAARAQFRLLHSPHSVQVVRYEGRAVGQDVILSVVSFFSFYALTVFTITVILGMLGLDFLTAVSGALTAVANVGPGIGGTIGPAGNFSTLSDPAKTVLALGMYLGRLEMLTVLVLLMPRFWRAA
jgi:trk system potassium uptake protein TrkH